MLPALLGDADELVALLEELERCPEAVEGVLEPPEPYQHQGLVRAGPGLALPVAGVAVQILGAGEFRQRLLVRTRLQQIVPLLQRPAGFVYCRLFTPWRGFSPPFRSDRIPLLYHAVLSAANRLPEKGRHPAACCGVSAFVR